MPVEERKCSLCDVVKDEYYCLVECPRYVNERRGLLSERLRDRPSMQEFVNYFKCEKENVQRKLGLLCLRVMKEHVSYV